MRPLRTLSAAAALSLVGPATPFVASAADEATKITSFNSALVEYFGPSLPAATASRRVLTTLASRGGYLPNQFQSKTLLGSTFCNVGKADKSTFEGQLEVGLGKASLIPGSSGSASSSAKGAAPININGIAGVPSAGAIKQLLAQCPQGGKAILVYGPTVDISATGEVGRDVRGYVGRSGLGNCGASIAVLDELRSRNRPTTATSGTEGGSLKSLVSGGGQEEEIFSKLRQNLLDAGVDINPSDKSYLMAEVSKKLFNVISDYVVKEVDSAIKQGGFWDSITEVVLLGGIVIDGEEDYFLPVTFQTISGGADGTTSANLIDNLYNADYDELSLPQNKQNVGSKSPASLPSVSLPTLDMPRVSLPDIKVPNVDLKLPSTPDIKAPDIKLPKVSAPKLGDLPAVSKTTANTLVGAGVATTVVGGGILAVNKLRNKNAEQAEAKVTKEPVVTPVENTPVETPIQNAMLIENDRKPIFSLPDFFEKKEELPTASPEAFPPTTQSPISLDGQGEAPEEKKLSLPSLSLPSVSLPPNPFGKQKEDSATSKIPPVEAPSPSLTTNDESNATKKLSFSFPPISVPNPFESKESVPTSLTTNDGESDNEQKSQVSLPSISIPNPLDSIRSGAIANRFRSGATSSLTDDLLALAFATNQGQDASSRQMESALDIVAKLEKVAPVPAKKLFSKDMEGTWELQFCSDPYSFRSNPFFMARRSSCSSDPILRSYYEDDCMNLQQVLLKSGKIDSIRQIVKGGQLVSEIDFSTGFGKSALVSLAALRPSSANTKLSAWDVSLRGTDIKGKYPQLARQLREIKAVMSGVIKAPPFATTYLDEKVRISRDQDGAVYVFRKINGVAKPTDYSSLARDTTKII